MAPLRHARGVWFVGGRQWHLADSYLHTLTEREIFNVLARGGVVGGSSAGASIQGSFLMRGDTKSNTVVMGDHQVGMGFLKHVAIDQHVLRRNRQFDLIGVVEAHPELLGIGLDENTAIIVHGDTAEVMGQSYALIYDDHTMLGPTGRFYFRQPGHRVDDFHPVAESEVGRPQCPPLPRGELAIDRIAGVHPGVDGVLDPEMLRRAHQVAPGLHPASCPLS